MAYVARYTHDVFVSYAHHDDRAWIEAFEDNLRRELSERLGHGVTFWQDEKRLRLGHDWPQEIEDAITGAATFLAIISPSYQTSEWCAKERKLFVQQFGSTAEMKVATKTGQAFRFLKVIKMPWEDDSHLGFFSEAQHVDFYERDAAKAIDDELLPGTDGFRARMRETAHSLASLLRAMRRQAETIFVATPADDVRDTHKALRSELAAQGYDVRPDGPVDDFYSDDAIVKLLEPAVRAIHLLGAVFEPIVERQAKLARELGKERVVWLSAEARNGVSDQQRALIGSLTEQDPGDLAPTVLTGRRRRMIDEVLALLAPLPASRQPLAAPGINGRPAVYMICDPSTPRDREAAQHLGAEMSTAEGIVVILPEPASAAGLPAAEAHRQRLQACDGLMLFRNTAPIQWLTQSLPDVLFAERLERQRPLRAKAILLDDPDLLRGVPGVIVCGGEPELGDLEPFLSQLRGSGENGARA